MKVRFASGIRPGWSRGLFLTQDGFNDTVRAYMHYSRFAVYRCQTRQWIVAPMAPDFGGVPRRAAGTRHTFHSLGAAQKAIEESAL